MKVYMVMVTTARLDWGGIDYIDPQAECVGVYDSREAAERTKAEFLVVLEKVRESGELYRAWAHVEEKELNKTWSVESWLEDTLGEESVSQFMEGEQA
jgi:hypothetical protein